MSGGPAQARAGDAGWSRWLPVLLVPVALLGNPGAAIPGRTYFFRDLTVAFLPLRLFSARELREGRIAWWNPYVFEGTFQLPSLYPPDLLHALWPSPAFVSWLLTLHLPLAALGAYWLARRLGTSRAAAFVSGTLFALCGFSASCLNLYLFLQALALAPIVAGLVMGAAGGGGRRCVAAAAAVALATSTLAVEFVGQALFLGLVLGGVRAGWRGVLRGLGAITLGLGLAGVPVLVVSGLLPETARGSGFEPEVALANALHPAVLLQLLLPNLFGLPGSPGEAWWGGRFFSKGLPYFLSLYVGPLALALASVGFRQAPRALRWALLSLGALGIWGALGEAGGLVTLVRALPLASAWRFPSKALLLPLLALVLLAGFGADALRDARAFGRLAGRTVLFAGTGAVVVGLLRWVDGLSGWAGVQPAFWSQVVRVAGRDAAAAGLVALVTVLLALAVRFGGLRPQAAGALVAALLAADLGRATTGLNRQVAPAFLDPLPALAARFAGAGRVFSYGLDHSPAFREVLQRGGREVTLGGFFVHRQILAPYTNMLDAIESPEVADLTGFAPRQREIGAELYDPARIGDLLPWLRNSAVSRVVSLDPLTAAGLEEAGPPVDLVPSRLAAHVYRVVDPWPSAYVACRVERAANADEALLRPYAPGFSGSRDVALEVAASADCGEGSAQRLDASAGRERYRVAADGSGHLVVRASYARGWRALVDGRPAPVLRANGKHRAVPVPAGAHEVALRYHPPGLWAGVLLSALSAVVAVVLAWKGRP